MQNTIDKLKCHSIWSIVQRNDLPEGANVLLSDMGITDQNTQRWKSEKVQGQVLWME